MSVNAYKIGFSRGIKPDKTLSISQWADKKRQLPKGASAEPGQWRTSRFPFVREPMDELSLQSTTQQVKVIKGTQVGGTEIGNNFIMSNIDQNPSTMLLILPTESLMKKHRKLKLVPSIKAMPDLAKKIKAGKTKDDLGDAEGMEFTGGHLVFGHSNSTANYRSLSIPNICLDDVDGFPLDVEGEGSPMDLAKKRADTFSNRKIYINSTPTTEGESNIQTEFENSDQREYYMPCPHCKELVFFEKDKFIFEYDEITYQLKGDVLFSCEHCGSLIEEYHKTWMMDEKNGAKWVPHNPGHEHRGYRIPSYLSPLGFLTWNEIFQEFLDAKKEMNRGNDKKMKTWTNTRAAKVWSKQFEKLELKFLMDKKEDYNAEVPYGVMILIAAFDTQDNRIEGEVIGYGANNEKWHIEKKVFMGDPAQHEVWEELDDYIQNTKFYHADGVMKIYAAGIDSGGNKTKHVMAYCKSRMAKRIYALKGANTLDAPLVSLRDAKYSKYKTPFLLVGVQQAKDDVWSSLKITSAGDSYRHFPNKDTYNGDYFEQLLAEHKVKKRWTPIRNGLRNENFDTCGYADAVLAFTGIDVNKLAKRGPYFYIEKKKKIVRKKRRIFNNGVA